MLRNLISRHPSIAICGETRFFADIYKRRSAFGPLDNFENRERLVDQYLSTARVHRLGLDVAALRQRLLDEATSYPAFLATIMRFNSDFRSKERCGEKTPHHSFCTETLSEWYPGAFIIHLVRDPRDVVASLQRMKWAPKSIWNNAWIWTLFNRGAERSRHRPGYLLVQYEKLVASPEAELARICEHVGEKWPESLSVADEESTPYSWPMSARGPVTRDRLQKWRDQLTPREVSLVERIAGERLQKYGYESNGRAASPSTVVHALAVAGYEMVRQRVVNLPYMWFYHTQPTNLPLHEYWKFRRAWKNMFPDSAPPNGRAK